MYLGLMLFVALSAASLEVQAQGSEVEQTAAARALFEQGVEFADQGQWERAADRFRRTLELRHTPIVAYNLAIAYEHTGRLVRAAELLRRVQRESQHRKVQRSAHERLEALLPRVARLTVTVQGPADTATIAVDDRPLTGAQLSVPLPADPGTRQVTAARKGVVLDQQQVQLQEGERKEVQLTVPPPSPAQQAEVPILLSAGDARTASTKEDPALYERWWFWAGIGAAAVAAAAGGYLILADDEPSVVQGNFSPGTLEL